MKDEKEELILRLIELVQSITTNPIILSVTNSIYDTIDDKIAIKYIKDLTNRIDPLTQLKF